MTEKTPCSAMQLIATLALVLSLAGCNRGEPVAEPQPGNAAPHAEPVPEAPTDPASEQPQPEPAPSTGRRIHVDDAFREMEEIASNFDCEINEGARPNSLVCLVRDEGFYAAVIHDDSGALQEVIIAAVSEDDWATELPHLELLLDRYYAMEVSGIRNIYPSLYDRNPTVRSGTEMALQSLLSTHSMFSDSRMSIPADTRRPWIAFSFRFD